ncbi:uncharacterized protein LOC134724566 [Mytilus trossulus]|uniref:uncharacterized protein LOC134724566 n=1 Tax=Mytilus trossulus TaxID=6551 RepID=UPI0030068908
MSRDNYNLVYKRASTQQWQIAQSFAGGKFKPWKTNKVTITFRMRPSSQIEAKCWLCPMTFRTRRQLKNHLAAAPHKRLSVICVWCPEEKSYRRMVDLKEHVMAHHRSKIELMPYSFLSENNGFWMANYPETYAKVILPSNENSQEAMKARIEVLEFLNRVDNTNRKKEEWTVGWKCPKEMVKGTQEEEVESEKPNGSYSPTRPTIYEGLALQQLTLGLGDSTAIFKLDLGVSIRFYMIHLNDSVLRDQKMLDALIRRMTALVNTKYAGSHTFSVSIDGKLKSIVTPVVARKLSIKEEYITDIKTSGELFPGKQTKAATNQLSPLKTPSTSDIILEDDSDNEEPEILEEPTSQKKGRKTTEKEEERYVEKRKKKTNHQEQKAKKIKKGKDYKKQDEEMPLTEEGQKRTEKQEQEEIKRKEEEHKKRETQKQEEEVRLKEAEQKRKEKQEQEEIKRKEEEHKKQETRKQEEEVRLKEAEQKRKEKQEQEEIKRKEEEHKEQETRKQEEEVRLKEAEQKRKEKQEQEEIRQKEEERKKQEKQKQEEEVRLKEAEQKRREKHKQDEEIRMKEEELRRQEEAETKRLAEETRSNEAELMRLQEGENLQS